MRSLFGRNKQVRIFECQGTLLGQSDRQCFVFRSERLRKAELRITSTPIIRSPRPIGTITVIPVNVLRSPAVTHQILWLQAVIPGKDHLGAQRHT